MGLHGPRAPPAEKGLHPDVDQDGLDPGGRDRTHSCPGVAGPSAKHPQQTEGGPHKAEVAEGRGRVEEAIRDPVASQRGEDLVDPGVERLDEGTNQADRPSAPTAATWSAGESEAGDTAGASSAAADAGSPPKAGQ